MKYHYLIWTIGSTKMNNTCLFESNVKVPLELRYHLRIESLDKQALG
jgi:hypothetical protein